MCSIRYARSLSDVLGPTFSLICDIYIKKKNMGKVKYKTEEERKQAIIASKKKYELKNANKIKEKNKIYQEKNKEKINLKGKKWREKNPEKMKEIYLRQKNKTGYKDKKNKYKLDNKEKIKINSKIYCIKNKEKIANAKKKWLEENPNYYKTYVKKRKLEDPFFKLKTSIRTIIYKSLKNKNLSKKNKTIDVLGCSFEHFKSYIESKFEPWMNWENQGNPKDGVFEINKTWDIDHIIPLSSAKSEEDIIKLNHYTNLQPLCSFTNRYVKKDNLFFS